MFSTTYQRMLRKWIHITKYQVMKRLDKLFYGQTSNGNASDYAFSTTKMHKKKFSVDF